MHVEHLFRGKGRLFACYRPREITEEEEDEEENIDEEKVRAPPFFLFSHLLLHLFEATKLVRFFCVNRNACR